MKKVLVIEDSETCCDCPCFSCGEEAYCNVLLKPVYELKRIDCPLKTLSRLVEDSRYTEYQLGFQRGFNACVDEIKGEKDESSISN